MLSSQPNPACCTSFSVKFNTELIPRLRKSTTPAAKGNGATKVVVAKRMSSPDVDSPSNRASAPEVRSSPALAPHQKNKNKKASVKKPAMLSVEDEDDTPAGVAVPTLPTQATRKSTAAAGKASPAAHKTAEEKKPSVEDEDDAGGATPTNPSRSAVNDLYDEGGGITAESTDGCYSSSNNNNDNNDDDEDEEGGYLEVFDFD